MFHENIRVARNHRRGLAARAVTVDSEVPPRPTTPAEKGQEKEKDDPPARTIAVATTARPGPDVTPISVKTSLSIVEPVVPTASDAVVTGPVIATTPVITTTPVTATPVTTTPVLPATTTSSVPNPSISSSKSVSIKLLTVTTVAKASSTSHVAISAKASASSTPVATGAVSGGAVAGGVIGGLAGLALLGVVVFFVVKRYRRKSLDALVFNASKFRRSALLLDDPPTPPEKEKMQEQRGPRPPSMIARHLNAPAVPQASAASPYSEHAARSTDPYGHYATVAAQYNVGMYGADGQVTRDPYADVYGGNSASGQHASHEQPAFGAPPMQFQFPQRPYRQQQGYQSSFAPSAHASAAAINAPLPNPFSNAPPSTSASTALAAARTAAQVKSASSDSSHSHSTSDTSSKHEVLHRRPSTQPGGGPPAYEDDPNYANIQRDVKVAPGTLVVVNNENNPSSSSASVKPATSTNISTSTAPTRSNTRRPMSSYTVYDPEDAYGGM